MTEKNQYYYPFSSILIRNADNLGDEAKEKLITSVRMTKDQRLISHLAYAGLLPATDIERYIVKPIRSDLSLNTLRYIIFDESAEREGRVTEKDHPIKAIIFARGLEGLIKSGQPIDDNSVQILEDLAFQSISHWSYNNFLIALSRARYFPKLAVGAAAFATFVNKQIAGAADSADRRSIRSTAISKALQQIPRPTRAVFIEALREKWRIESEPQSKLALASIIINAAQEPSID